MEFKGTRGEWTVRFLGDGDNGENDFFVEAPNLNKPELGHGIEILMDDYGDHNGYPREQRLADAKLIAAAPELLKALTTIRDAFWTDGEDQEQRLGDLKSIADSAIKKALS